MEIDPEIQQAVDSIHVIDTHEHQEEESVRLGVKLDFYRMFEHYAESDLVVAGMPSESVGKLRNPEVPIDEKWRLFEPHYLAARNTAYLKAARIAIRDLYGIEELNGSTYATLTERMRERNKPGVVRWILRDRCRIRCGQVNNLENKFFRLKTDPDLFQQDLSVVAMLRWPSAIASLEKEFNVSITTLDADLAKTASAAAVRSAEGRALFQARSAVACARCETAVRTAPSAAPRCRESGSAALRARLHGPAT